MDNRTPDERFWPRVVPQSNGCWLWTGGKTGTGYGSFSIQGRHIPAHRYAYVSAVGVIPDGMVLDHQCHNADQTCDGGPCAHRACVNPDHLEPVTQKDNLLNSPWTVNRTSAAATHCPTGHPYDEPNTGYDGTDRYCRTCKRASELAGRGARNAAKRERYTLLRASGLSAAEARSASKRKLARHGIGDC